MLLSQRKAPAPKTKDHVLIYPQDHVLYSSFNGIVLADKEGKEIARCLGDRKAALLQNHGLLTVGQTIEAAVFWFISLEKCCHAQLMADAAAGGRGHKTVKIDDEDAAFTYKTSTYISEKLFCPISRGDRTSHERLPTPPCKDEADSEICAVGTPMAGWFSARPLFDVIERECGDDYMQ